MTWPVQDGSACIRNIFDFWFLYSVIKWRRVIHLHLCQWSGSKWWANWPSFTFSGARLLTWLGDSRCLISWQFCAPQKTPLTFHVGSVPSNIALTSLRTTYSIYHFTEASTFPVFTLRKLLTDWLTGSFKLYISMFEWSLSTPWTCYTSSCHMAK